MFLLTLAAPSKRRYISNQFACYVFVDYFDTIAMKLYFNVLIKSIFGLCFPNYAKDFKPKLVRSTSTTDCIIEAKFYS